MDIVITSFFDRRSAQLEEERRKQAATLGKERFEESRSDADDALASFAGRISDEVHPKVAELLNAPARDFVTFDVDTYRMAVRQYLLEKIEKDGVTGDRIDVPWAACIGYVEGFLTDLAVMAPRAESVVADPYVSSWKEKGRYDLAGDAALYGYLYYHVKATNRLTRRDYADMCVRSYYDWYGQGVARNEFNVGKYVADRLPRLLPKVADCPRDLFVRRFRTV